MSLVEGIHKLRSHVLIRNLNKVLSGFLAHVVDWSIEE